MHEIFLIRHTAPAVARGICYGQSDIDVTETFIQEASVISQVLPERLDLVYSSPLLRCRKLAEHLFCDKQIVFENDLMEIHCGQWEMQQWDSLPREIIDPWMNDFVNQKIPGGESYVEVFARVSRCFDGIVNKQRSAAIVCHGGVIRSILAHITATPLAESFNRFKLHYGCVVKVIVDEKRLSYQVISNVATEAETHKPSSNAR